MNKIRTNLYLHTNKEGMYEMGGEIGLEGPAQDDFRYVGYEVDVRIVVDEDTGEALATHLNGSKLEKPVKV